MTTIRAKKNITFILVSLFLAIICAILFILQNYSKIEFTASVDEEDDAGNRVMQSYHINGGLQDKYEYNYGADGSLTSIDKHDGVISYGYNATGQLISKKTVYGSSNSYRYNYQYLVVPVTNRATNIMYSSSFTVGTASSTYSYTYYPNGNLKCVFKDGTLQKEYVYDEYDRLTVENDYELNYQWWNTYDSGGNLYAKDLYQLDPHVHLETYWYGYYSSYKDQLSVVSTSTGNTYYNTYDNAGNPINYMGKTMTWQNGRELKTVNGHINYKYDYSGLRTQKNVSGITTDYYLEGSQILMEKRSDQQYGYWYFYDESGVYGVQIAGINYIYEKNILGDITALYNMYTGAKVGEYRYDAWGITAKMS